MPVKYLSKLPPGTPEYKICAVLGNHAGARQAINFDYLTRLTFGGLRDDDTKTKCLRIIAKLKRDYHIPILRQQAFRVLAGY